MLLLSSSASRIRKNWPSKIGWKGRLVTCVLLVIIKYPGSLLVKKLCNRHDVRCHSCSQYMDTCTKSLRHWRRDAVPFWFSHPQFSNTVYWSALAYIRLSHLGAQLDQFSCSDRCRGHHRRRNQEFQRTRHDERKPQAAVFLSWISSRRAQREIL